MSDNLRAESPVTCRLCHAIGTNHCGHVNCPLSRLVVPAAMVIDGAEMRAKIPADASDEHNSPMPLRYNAWVYPTADSRAPDRWLLIYRDKPRSRPGAITIGYGYEGGGQEVTLDAATATVFANAILETLRANGDDTDVREER
jgi:hypothetical protein